MKNIKMKHFTLLISIFVLSIFCLGEVVSAKTISFQQYLANTSAEMIKKMAVPMEVSDGAKDSEDALDLNSDSVETIKKNYFSTKQESELEESSKDIVVITNNGSEIDNDVIKDSDMGLYAVVEYEKDSVDYQDMYFYEDKPNDSAIKEDIEQDLEQEIIDTNINLGKDKSLEVTNLSNTKKKNYEIEKMAAKGSSHVVRTLNWTFKKGRKISTTVDLKRASADSKIDGKVGSIWNVTTHVEYTDPKKYTLRKQITKIAIPYSAQKLLDYGPDSNSSGKASVSLSGAGVPSISYSFGMSGHKVTNLSSKSSKYGRWEFKETGLVSGTSRLVTRPAIRSSNTSGSFGVQISHSSEIGVFPLVNEYDNTGVITIYTPDR
ncbi:hypothetical protein HCA64_07770 [Listeria booriae]|uniref:hypothetical protein n=1 Tax=Listeria booriae TaxID=1552123 RepID=UPI0016299CB0|nr:hypothetical protein [Listeria booriae]MBC1906370.1 hypothetical protein [Listeria booriae]